MARKSSNEKLNDNKDLPKIIDLAGQPGAVEKWGGKSMVVAPAVEYNEVMAKIPEGKLVTSTEIRQYVAKKHNVELTCPLTAGIFINLCANASYEREDNQIPYWRTLKAKGELNEKYPEGIEGQKIQLELEGHTIIQKGKKYFVKNYEEKLYKLK